MSGTSRKSETEAEQYGQNELFAKNDSNTRQSFATTSTYSNSLDIGDIVETNDAGLMSTSAVLFFCKSRILNPYLKLLAMMGLRPLSLNQIQVSVFFRVLSNYHTFQMSLLICLGYVLQYMSCFRRDRGFFYQNSMINGNYQNNSDIYEKICYGNSTFNYYIPSILHFIGYVYAIYLFKISDNEQLQNLMERVFLLSSFPPQRIPYTSPKKLLKILWVYIVLSICWIITSFVIVILMISHKKIKFCWLDENSSNYSNIVLLSKWFLVICTLTHDMIQATIITNYCLQAQLLTSHLYFLRSRLITRTISPLDWMRELAEFKKLLKHLNEVLCPVICIFTTMNICWTLSGIIWLFNADKIENLTNHDIRIHIVNQSLWLILTIVPFISAARLTTACSVAQTAGHEISVRPFLYQDANQSDLNTVLAFASSLQLSARLFRVPITGRYLCLAFVIVSIVLLTTGMSHYIEI